MDNSLEIIKTLFRTHLQLGERADFLNEDSPIIGAIPEFDSIAVVGLIAALEQKLNIKISDEEINNEVFETVGSLASFVSGKMR